MNIQLFPLIIIREILSTRKRLNKIQEYYLLYSFLIASGVGAALGGSVTPNRLALSNRVLLLTLGKIDSKITSDLYGRLQVKFCLILEKIGIKITLHLKSMTNPFKMPASLFNKTLAGLLPEFTSSNDQRTTLRA